MHLEAPPDGLFKPVRADHAGAMRLYGYLLLALRLEEDREL